MRGIKSWPLTLRVPFYNKLVIYGEDKMKKVIAASIMGLALACSGGSGGGESPAPQAETVEVAESAPQFDAKGIHVDFTYHRSATGNVIFTVHNRPESYRAIPSGMIVRGLITNIKDNQLVYVAQYSDLEPGKWMEWDSPNTYYDKHFEFSGDSVSILDGNVGHPVGSANIHGLQPTNPSQVVRHVEGFFDYMGWRK